MSNKNKTGADIFEAMTKHAKSLEFGFISQSLGKIVVGILSTNNLCELEEKVPKPNLIDSRELAIKLFSIVAKKVNKNEKGDYFKTPLSETETNQLTEKELQEISKIFIELNFARGKKIFDSIKIGNLEYTDHLKKCLIHKNEDFKNIFKSTSSILERISEKIVNPFKPSPFEELVSDTTNQLYRDNLAMSKRLGESLALPPSSIFHTQRPPLLDLTPPEDPVHESNKLLKDVKVQLNNLNKINNNASTLIKNLNDLGTSTARAMTENNDRNAKHSKFMLVIAVMTLFFTLVISVLSFQESRESNKKMNEFLSNIILETELTRKLSSSIKSDLSKDIDSLNKNMNAKISTIEKAVSNNSHELNSLKDE